MPLQVRRGSTADRTGITPLSGELIWDITQSRLYVGDGSTAGGVAAASYSNAEAQDASAEIFTTGSHTGISFSYNSLTKQISAIVNPDLSNYAGTIGADAFKGSFFGDDSTILIDGVLNSINLEQTIRGNVVPFAPQVYDIGSSGLPFKDLYLSGAAYIGNAVISSSGTAISLPVGSTIGGVVIEGGAGVIPGSNYNINIVADDSGTLVDSSSGTFYGNFRGSVYDSNGDVVVDIPTTYLTTEFTGRKMFLGDATGNADVRLQLNAGGISAIQASSYHNDASPSRVSFARAKGTSASPTAVTNSDALFSINFQGYDGTGITTSSSIVGSVGTSGTVSSGVVPGALAFNIQNGAGTTITPLFMNSDATVNVNTTFKLNGSEAYLYAAQNNSGTKSVRMARSRGTVLAPTTVNPNDRLYEMRWQGYDGTGYTTSAILGARVDSAGSVSNGVVPGSFAIQVADGTGTVNTNFSINGVAGTLVFSSLNSVNIDGASLVMDEITIDTNVISTTNSNANIELTPNGTGTVQLNVPSQSTVGAAGGASALPATPDIYIKVNVNGTDYVVPAFAVS